MANEVCWIEMCTDNTEEAKSFYGELFGWTLPGSEFLADLRTAMRDNHTVRIGYTDVKGATTERTIRPLGVFFWGATATLGAWCELREDFRNFRLDRIKSLEVLSRVYASEPGRSLQDYYASMAERYEHHEDG